MSIIRKRSVIAGVGVTTALVALVGSAGTANAASQAGPGIDPLGGKVYGVQLLNQTASGMDVAFTLNSESANGYTAPHCVYKKSEGRAATTLPSKLTNVNSKQQLDAGVIEHRNSGNC